MKLIIKIFSFLFGCYIIYIIVIASHSKWFESFCNNMPSPYRNGDLYLFSNMPGYRMPLNRKMVRTPVKFHENNISLTIVGDSYMRDFDSASFFPYDYRFIHWNNVPDTIQPLDNTKTNILIIETAERYCRWRLSKENIIFIGEKKQLKTEKNEIKLNAEDNLQYIVTSQDWVLPFKELKTYIYLNCFDKFDERVAKPDGKGRLYLEETINSEKNTSSYNYVSEIEIDSIVNKINIMSNNAQKIGYKKVYISIIPNASSLYLPINLPYNHLIERIQNNKNLKVPFIDAYGILKKQKVPVFYNNDSHWNMDGQIVWLANTMSIIEGLDN